jgi:beta-galactosidase/beta-glucuronidase
MNSFILRSLRVFFILVFLAISVGCSAVTFTSPRESISLSDDWRFSIDKDGVGEKNGWFSPVFDDTAWTTVTVPHTWNVMPGYSDYAGLAWYRKTFTISEKTRGIHLRLHFEAVFYMAHVWLNGQALGNHEGGYTPFEFDISNIAKPGQQNVIAVEVDNLRASDRLPANLFFDWSYDWWNYGGITRDVSLEATSPTFVLRQQVVSIPHLTDVDQADSASIEATVIIDNASKKAFNGSVQANLLDNVSGKIVLKTPATTTIDIPANGNISVKLSATVASPKLWHFDHPNLYRWSLSLLDKSGKGVDKQEVIIGIRSIELKGGRFYLNGEPVRLVGLDTHMDYPGQGSAETVIAMAADYNDLKTLNEVFTRPVHYPQASYILDYADQHGILLIPEVPAWQLTAQQLSSPHMQSLEKQQLGEMIAADFNHPSVWAWSVGNEFASNSSAGYNFVKEMIAHVKSLDPSRPVGFASDKLGSQPQADATALSDFVEMNNYFGTWHGTKQDLGPALDRVHEAFPDKTVIISEFGFAPHWNDVSASSLNPANYYFIPDNVPSDSEQADMIRREVIEDQMPIFSSKPFVAGAIFWSYQDYRTPANYKTGLVDATRNKRSSWSVLRDAFSPALVDSVTFSAGTGNKQKALVDLHTRGPVDKEIPAYTLRGYSLHWAVTSPKGDKMFSSGDISLPILAPGSKWSGNITWTIPGEDYILTISVIRPTGFSVIERTYDVTGAQLP